MHANAHIEVLKLDDSPDGPDDFDHSKAHVNDIFRFFDGVPLGFISEAEHDVAVADCVQFEQVEVLAALIELSEKVLEHINDLFCLHRA